jgi:CubicO group peptidase (beta-lactamase class C family)
MRRFFVFALTSLSLLAAGEHETQVDRIFSAYSAPGSPGCAVGVLSAGRSVLAKGYGFADLEQRLPITPRSRFYMASVSKHFTSLALLLAEQEGKLRLDDSIRKYIPELPPYAEAITIRRMLDHTAGLRDYLALWSLRGFSNESILREDPTLALILRQKALNFAPGDDHNYSNTGYLLAAVALRRATGKPLETYAREKIYQPLEMHASRFQADHGDPVADRAHGYHLRDGAWKTVDVGFDLIGSGGMYSNVEDMLKWARNFDAPAVAAPLLPALGTPGRLNDGRRTPTGYALGLRENEGTYSHSGAAAGYSTHFLRIPAARLSVVCLCNAGGTPVAELAEKVAAVYTGKPLPPRPASTATPPAPRPWNAGEAAQLAGSYWSEELFTVWTLTQRDGRLWLHFDGPTVEVEPAAGGAYRAGGFELRKTAQGLSVSVGRAGGILFLRR